MVSAIKLLTIPTLLLLISPASIYAQLLNPRVELRTSEQLILDPGQQIELTIMVVDAREQNSISLKLNTIGGVQVKDISLLNTYIYVNKQISPTGASIDLAKTDLFTSEDIVGTVTVEMTGLEDGAIIVSGASVINESEIGKDFKVDIKYSGATPIPQEPNGTPVVSVIGDAITDFAQRVALRFGVTKDLALLGMGLIIVVVLIGIFFLLKQLDHLKQRPPKPQPTLPITTQDLKIISSPKLTPIPPTSQIAPGVESPAPSQTVVPPNLL
jgi:hypothetical protein